MYEWEKGLLLLLGGMRAGDSDDDAFDQTLEQTNIQGPGVLPGAPPLTYPRRGGADPAAARRPGMDASLFPFFPSSLPASVASTLTPFLSCQLQADAEGPEVVLAEADALAAQEGKATEAGALYKKVGTMSVFVLRGIGMLLIHSLLPPSESGSQVYEELSKEETPPAYLQARCLAGLGASFLSMQF